MSSSSSDDIAAYLAHLKQSTSVEPKPSRGHISPTKDSILSDVLSTSPSKLSPVKKSSLRSPQKISSISANIQKYQDKYVKKPAKVAGKILVRRSSVVFSVPVGDEGSPIEPDPTDSATPEDSLMDDILAKFLEETSISDEPGEFEGSSDGAPDRVKGRPFPPFQYKMKSTNETMGGDKTKETSTLDPSTTLSAKPNLERKLGKGRLLQDTSRPKSAENYKGVKPKTSDGRSLSFENSDLKSVPEEDLEEDRTLSTTPERSHKNPLRKQKRSVFRSSAIKDDDSTSTSSSSQQYLSKRISRRNSYIYKEECALVSAASSNETIITDPELSESSEILELETDDRIPEATSPVHPKMSSENEISKPSHSPARKPLKVSEKAEIDAKVFTGSKMTSVKETLVADRKKSDRSGIGISSRPSSSVLSPSSEYSSSDFEPSSGTKSSHKSSSNISHNTSNQTSLSDLSSRKPRPGSMGRRTKHKHEKTKRSPSSSSPQTSSVSSSSEGSSDSSSSVQRHLEKKKKKKKKKEKKERVKENRHKHSYKSSRKYSCMNCERMRGLLCGAPRMPWPPYDGSRAFLQHAAAGYPVSREQAGLTNVSPNVARVEDALMQTIILGRQFLMSQRAMYDAYCTTLTSSYRYTTMQGIEKIIGKCRRPPTTLPEAYQKANKDLLDQMRGK